MKAVDTNILARFFVDDPDDAEATLQKPLAIKAMSQSVFVSLPVVLELEWVMRGFYELPCESISQVLKALCGLENVTIEHRETLLTAVDAYEKNLDCTDALHLAHAKHCRVFVSFDKKLHKNAHNAKLLPIVEIPTLRQIFYQINLIKLNSHAGSTKRRLLSNRN